VQWRRSEVGCARRRRSRLCRPFCSSAGSLRRDRLPSGSGLSRPSERCRSADRRICIIQIESIHFLISLSLRTTTTYTHEPQGRSIHYRGYLHVLKYLLLLLLLPRDACINCGLCRHAVSICLSVYLCVCLSVTFVHSVKTGKYIVRLFSPSGRSIILVFPNQTAIVRRGPPNGGVEYKGVWKKSRFLPISRFISKMMQDKAIVTMEGE